ncbi:MAG: PKD-like family lipoprotein [Dysgonomonas sp.]|nr:PKD-like family lipoprotein [Dysgonomonas sp.]
MKKINIFLLLNILFLGYFLSSCNDDKGNYDYVDVTDVIDASNIFTNGKTDYDVEPGQFLEIKPILNVEEGVRDDEFTFKWYGYPYNSNKDKKGILLSEGKDLSFQMQRTDEFDWTTPGKYTIVCEVTNKKSGVSRYFKANINVNNLARYGYMILTKRPNNTFDIDVLARTGTGVRSYPYTNEYTFDSLYLNVFSNLGGDIDLTATPVGLATFPDFFSPKLATNATVGNADARYSVCLITDKKTYRLNPVNYAYDDQEFNIHNLFEKWSPLAGNTSLKVDKIEARAYGAVGFNSLPGASMNLAVTGNQMKAYYRINNNWYFYNTHDYWYLMDEPINRIKDDKGNITVYNSAPHVLINMTNNNALLFNNDSKKFMIQPFSNTNPDEITFTTELGNETVQEKMLFADKEPSDPSTELVYMTEWWERSANIYGIAITKGSNSDQYRLATFRSTKAAKGPEANDTFKRVYLPAELKNVKYWIRRQNRLFCVTTNNRIYSIALNDLPAEFDNTGKSLDVEVPGKDASYWAGRFTDVTSDLITDSYTQISCFKNVDDGRNKAHWTYQCAGSAGVSGPTVALQGAYSGSIALATYDPAKPEGKNGKITFLEFNSTENRLVPSKVFQKLVGKDKVPIDNPVWTGMGEIVDIVYKIK